MFIVVDGMDGAGKGEAITRLTEYFKNKGFDVALTREPTDGPYGRQARNILKNEKDPLGNALKCLDLFVKDREQHVKNVIEPHLIQPNTIVICDRYYYSTIAYQSNQGLDIGMLIDVNTEFRKPDIAFFLDLPVEIALQRIQTRGEQKEKFEDKQFMEKLRHTFLSLKNKMEDNIVIIDASKTREEVAQQLQEACNTFLQKPQEDNNTNNTQ